jgi:mRNA interferase MazF
LYRFASPDKERPVVVLTRQSSIQRLSSVSLAPITSATRGVPSEVALDEADGMKMLCVVNLHNVVTLARRRLGRRVARLGLERMDEVCDALRFALGCEE